MELLCDSHHGVYIPQIMINRLVDAGWENITQEQMDDLNTGPYNCEWYWDSWDMVLNNARYMDDDGETWFLHQDGDLWACTQADFDEMGEF